MNNKKRLTIILSSLAMMFSFSFNLKENNPIKVDAIGNYSTNASTYYSGITATSGKQLAAQLHDLITSTHRYYTSYDDNGKNGYQKNTDQYYENGTKVNGYLYEFYSGVKWPNAWASDAGDTTGGYNREHCWCQSNSVNNSGTQMWGTTGGGADMHHIRPVESRLNSTRNNHPYGEVANRDSNKAYAKFGTNQTYALGGYCANDTFEPLDSKKGDVARIILYTYLHYNSYTVSDLFGSYGTTNGSGDSGYFSTSLLSVTKIMKPTTESAALEMLLSWNNSDPVDDIERRRNEQVAIYQGNRNPFIDNSAYADAIWAAAGITSISKTTASIATGSTTKISATSSNGANITWSSSSTSKVTINKSTAASGSEVTLTGVAAGSATITASITISGQSYSKTCAVTVTASKTLLSIDVTDPITSFTVGDTFSFGGTVTAYYNDSTSSNVTNSSTFTGYDMSTRGIQTVAVTYSGITTTYEISVKRSGEHDTQTVTLSIAAYATANEWVNGTKYTSIALATGITAVVENGGGNTGKYYTSGNEWRYYQSESAQISINAATGYALDEVTFTYSIGNTGVLLDSENNQVASGTPVEISGAKVIFSVGNSGSATNGQVKFTSIEVVYHEEEIEPTSISAIVEKTYYVGEEIVSSDIIVEDNFGTVITDFAFEYDGYRFTYDDAASGGTLTDCTFESAITYSDFSCDLTVQVQRKAHKQVGQVSDTLNRAYTGATGNTYVSWSSKAAPTSNAYYCGNNAGNNDSIQLRTTTSSGSTVRAGIVSTVSGGSISSVSVVWNTNTTSGRSIDVYGKNTAYSTPNDLWSNSDKGTLIGSISYDGTNVNGSLDVSDNYTFIGIRSNNGAIYITNITITYGAEDSAINLSNYIMYEDTNNQCTTKFATAKGYFENLSSSERNAFMNSTDYVIAAARERLEAWARHQGQSISYSQNDYVFNNNTHSALTALIAKNSSTIITIVIVAAIAVLGTGGYFLFKKKEE